MYTTVAGISGLRNLRCQLQEDAGADFPEDILSQLLTLYDVCNTMELNIFQIVDVMGKDAYQAVNDYLDNPSPLPTQSKIIDLDTKFFTVR